MVVLSILDPNRPTILQNGAVLRHPVPSPREELCQVKRGVGIVTDAKQEHLPVQLIHPADGTVDDVGRKRKSTGGDPRRLWAGCRAGKWVGATHYARQPPENVR